jgi:hypothetical protein
MQSTRLKQGARWKQGARFWQGAAARFLAAMLLAAFVLAPLLLPAPAAAESGRDRLTRALTLLTSIQLKNDKTVPDQDKTRTAQCLAKAIAADVPVPEAGQLADIFEGKAPVDRALEAKWLTISAKDAPARNAQVMAAVSKLCVDLGPYIKPML